MPAVRSLLPLASFPAGLPSYTNPCFWPLVLAAWFWGGSSCGLTSVQLFSPPPPGPLRSAGRAGQVGSWRIPLLRDTQPLALRLQVVLPVGLPDVEVLTAEGRREGGLFDFFIKQFCRGRGRGEDCVK